MIRFDSEGRTAVELERGARHAHMQGNSTSQGTAGLGRWIGPGLENEGLGGEALVSRCDAAAPVIPRGSGRRRPREWQNKVRLKIK